MISYHGPACAGPLCFVRLIKQVGWDLRSIRLRFQLPPFLPDAMMKLRKSDPPIMGD